MHRYEMKPSVRGFRMAFECVLYMLVGMNGWHIRRVFYVSETLLNAFTPVDKFRTKGRRDAGLYTVLITAEPSNLVSKHWTSGGFLEVVNNEMTAQVVQNVNNDTSQGQTLPRSFHSDILNL